MDKKQIFKMGSSEQNFNSNLTVSQLRKKCRGMNPQPATGMAISGF